MEEQELNEKSGYTYQNPKVYKYVGVAKTLCVVSLVLSVIHGIFHTMTYVSACVLETGTWGLFSDHIYYYGTILLLPIVLRIILCSLERNKETKTVTVESDSGILKDSDFFSL